MKCTTTTIDTRFCTCLRCVHRDAISSLEMQLAGPLQAFKRDTGVQVSVIGVQEVEQTKGGPKFQVVKVESFG